MIDAPDWKPGDPLYPAPPYEVGDVPPRWHDDTRCDICTATPRASLSCGRVADGVPSGLVRDPLHALGNAVVPQVAEYVGRLIMQHEEAAA